MPVAPWLATRCGHRLPSVASEGRRQAQGGGGGPVRFLWPCLGAGLGGVGRCRGSPSGGGAWAGLCEELRGRCGAHSPLCFPPQTDSMAATAAVSPSEYLQPAASSAQVSAGASRDEPRGRPPCPREEAAGRAGWGAALWARSQPRAGSLGAAWCCLCLLPLLCHPKDPRGRVSCGCRGEVGTWKRCRGVQGRCGQPQTCRACAAPRGCERRHTITRQPHGWGERRAHVVRVIKPLA